jgi:hypothetical protein
MLPALFADFLACPGTRRTTVTEITNAVPQALESAARSYPRVPNWLANRVCRIVAPTTVTIAAVRNYRIWPHCGLLRRGEANGYSAPGT